MPGEPVLVMDHVTKRFRRGRERSNWRGLVPGRWGEGTRADTFNALDDVSFQVAPGESLGLVGRNGAGKSTALKVLAGVIDPSEGTVSRVGRVASIIELGVGFEPDLTGRENLDFAGSLLGLGPAEIRRRADEIAEFAELQDFMGMPVKRYSSGMKARLGFALVSAIEAEVYVLDEVFAVGDMRFRKRCFDRVSELRARGAALLLVSHELNLMIEHCDSLILLEHGKVTASGDPTSVIEAYLGPDALSRWIATRPAGDAEAADLDLPQDEPASEGPPGPAEPPPDRPDGEAAADAAGADVVIERLDVTPTSIHPHDPLRLRAEVTVRVPCPEARFVMTIGLPSHSLLASAEQAPSAFLGHPGRWVVEAEVASLPFSSGVFEVRAAVLTGNEDDPHQLFLGALARAAAPLQIIGGDPTRPAFILPVEWEPVTVGPGPEGTA